jgi:hypothetical protein
MWKNSPFIQTPSARLPLANFTCTDEFAIGWVFSVVWIKVVPDFGAPCGESTPHDFHEAAMSKTCGETLAKSTATG